MIWTKQMNSVTNINFITYTDKFGLNSQLIINFTIQEKKEFAVFRNKSNVIGAPHPYDGVHLRGGDLLGPLDGAHHLLLMLEQRQQS